MFTPSAYLRELALAWGVDPGRVSVLPNPAPAVPALPPREELRAGLGLNGSTIAFAGRLTAQKSLERALEAVAGTDDVRFLIAGDGPDRAQLEGRARALESKTASAFLGAQPRERVVELFHAVDATILSSSWENFTPHTVVEALAVGTPVLAMEAGGVAEVVHDGVNGLLVPAGDTTRSCGRREPLFLGRGLTRPTARSCGRLRRALRAEVFGELEAKLLEVARR